MLERRARGVDGLPAGLPGAQAEVHVLERHAVGLVEDADLAEHVAAQVHARARRAEHRQRDVGLRVRRVLEAVAVVEPLRSAEVAIGAGRLDPLVGVDELGPGDADARAAVGGVLQAGQPPAARDDVGVQDDDVAIGRDARDAGVGRAGEAPVLRQHHDLRAPVGPQGGGMGGVGGGIVDDDHAEAAAARRAPEALGGLDRQRRVPVAGDHRGDRAPVAPVPAPRDGLHAAVARSVAQARADRRRAQGEGDDAQGELARAVVLEGEPAAADEVGQRALRRRVRRAAHGWRGRSSPPTVRPRRAPATTSDG